MFGAEAVKVSPVLVALPPSSSNVPEGVTVAVPLAPAPPGTEPPPTLPAVVVVVEVADIGAQMPSAVVVTPEVDAVADEPFVDLEPQAVSANTDAAMSANPRQLDESLLTCLTIRPTVGHR